MSANQYFNNLCQQFTPLRVYNTSATSGTYQAAADDRLKLHVLYAEAPIYINRGTGSSVSVTTSNGIGTPSGTWLPFHVLLDAESVGWVSADGSAVRVSIAVMSR